jgi:hypothetical protein
MAQTNLQDAKPSPFTRRLHNGTFVKGEAFHEMQFNSKVQNFLVHHYGIERRIALYMVLIGTELLKQYFDPKDDKKPVLGGRSGFKTEAEAIAFCKDGFARIKDIAEIEIINH